MLLYKLQVRNFGPYFGKQELDFGLQRPVVLVHGANMRGKTTLLNAIRWALYRKALDRFGKAMPTKNLVNWDAAAGGNWTLSVDLSMDVDGVSYELSRLAQPKDASITPQSDADFDFKLFLRRNDILLNQDQSQTEINRLLPEQIARFFLFDGELLNEYEMLLAQPNAQSQLIKESIEQILGVPAMTNAIADLKLNLQDAAKRQRTLARKDESATLFASIAADLESSIEALQVDIEELNAEAEQLRTRQLTLDERVSQYAALEADAQRLQDLDQQIARLKKEEQTVQQEKRDKLVDAWRDVLQPTLQRRLSELELEREAAIHIIQRVGELQARVADLERLSTSGICPTCGEAPSDARSATSRRLDVQAELDGLAVDESKLASATQALQRLRLVQPAGVAETIRFLESRLVQIRVDVVSLDLDRDRVEERIKGHDQVEILRTRRDYNEVTKELGVLEATIAGKQSAIGDKERAARENRARISKVRGGPELDRLNREVELYEDLIGLFQRAVDRLRDDLRKDVERDGSEIFRKLTTDKSYRGLRINEFYGLTIVDSSGGDVQVRSAGAEQIVALSLIGALNQNAVRRGPIVMDTPFGRLDPRHRENILRFLPTVANQVTLLVHGGEVDRDRDLEAIRDQIDKEYSIEYVSSGRSQITLIKA